MLIAVSHWFGSGLWLLDPHWDSSLSSSLNFSLSLSPSLPPTPFPMSTVCVRSRRSQICVAAWKCDLVFLPWLLFYPESRSLAEPRGSQFWLVQLACLFWGSLSLSPAKPFPEFGSPTLDLILARQVPLSTVSSLWIFRVVFSDILWWPFSGLLWNPLVRGSDTFEVKKNWKQLLKVMYLKQIGKFTMPFT